jgi:hypothetical protein
VSDQHADLTGNWLTSWLAAAVLLMGLAVSGAAIARADVPTTTPILQISVQAGTGAGAPGAATVIVSAGATPTTCSATCDFSIAPGVMVKLAVAAATGYAFTNWSDTGFCVAAQSPVCSFAMPSSGAQVAAIVQPATNTLTVVPGSAGTITAGEGAIDCVRNQDETLSGTCAATFPTGTTVKLSVKAAGRKHFVRWSIWQCGSRPTCEVPLRSDMTVTALITPVRLIITRSGSGGSVTAMPGELDCSAPCQQASTNLPLGTPVTFSAVAGTGSVFTGWGAPCAGPIGSCTLTLSSDAAVAAAFGQAGVPVLGSAPTLVAAPASGAATAQGCRTSGFGSYSFQLSVGRGGVVLFTAPGSCKPVRCDPSCYGRGYTQFQSVTLTARPAHGWTLKRWVNGCQRGLSCPLPVFGHSWVKAVFGRRHR